MQQRKRDNQRRKWRKIFNSIMEYYEKVKFSSGANSVEGFYSGLAREGAGRAAFNPRVVRPSVSDFICDIELTARRTLKGQEYGRFTSEFIEGRTWHNSMETCDDVGLSIADKLGRVFEQASIYPLPAYFSATDLR